MPHISVDNDGLPCAPDKTAGEEDNQKHHAVVPLQFAAGHVDLVQEPVDIEAWAGELVEDECWGVVVDERSLIKYTVRLVLQVKLEKDLRIQD